MDDGKDANKAGEGLSGKRTTPSPTGPRKDLTDLAVKFLTNPKVMSHPEEAKKTFLRKKGLTEAEIDQAIKVASKVQPPPASPAAATTPPSAVPPPLPPRALAPVQPVQRYRPRTWGEYAMVTAVVGGVGYALYHFVRTYVVPWLKAPRQQVEVLQAVQSSVGQLSTSMTETVASLKDSNRTMQALLSEQQQQMQVLTAQVTGLQTTLAQHTNGQSLRQLKEEISTLKGLLLNRHQFPASPTSIGRGGASIPEWQRTPNSTHSKALTPSRSPPAGQLEDTVVTENEAGMEESSKTREELVVPHLNGNVVAGDKKGLDSEEEDG